MKDFLLSKGIPETQLSYKGYGSSSPIMTDGVISAISDVNEKEKAHQKNRRTTYTLKP